MLLSVRQLLNESDDDVATVTLLTNLVLPVAESLQLMRRAAQRALAACVDERRPRDAVGGPRDVVGGLDLGGLDGRAPRLLAPSQDASRQQAVVPYRGSVYSGMGLSDDEDYRLTLVALESCDAAYRQIQVRLRLRLRLRLIRRTLCTIITSWVAQLSNCNVFSLSFAVNGRVVWNTLPAELRLNMSLAVFRKRLKHFWWH